MSTPDYSYKSHYKYKDSRHNQVREIYTMDISEEKDRFAEHHRLYQNHRHSEYEIEKYIDSLVEQMIAHFDHRDTAVQNFIQHYVDLMTEGASPNYRYHPMKFLGTDLLDDEYQRYVNFLWGFAEDIYALLTEHRMYNQQGHLRASFDGVRGGTLYLRILPEVSNVFLY